MFPYHWNTVKGKFPFMKRPCCQTVCYFHFTEFGTWPNANIEEQNTDSVDWFKVMNNDFRHNSKKNVNKLTFGSTWLRGYTKITGSNGWLTFCGDVDEKPSKVLFFPRNMVAFLSATYTCSTGDHVCFRICLKALKQHFKSVDKLPLPCLSSLYPTYRP